MIVGGAVFASTSVLTLVMISLAACNNVRVSMIMLIQTELTSISMSSVTSLLGAKTTSISTLLLAGTVP